jgi:hypothetical protein
VKVNTYVVLTQRAAIPSKFLQIKSLGIYPRDSTGVFPRNEEKSHDQGGFPQFSGFAKTYRGGIVEHVENGMAADGRRGTPMKTIGPE